jgi:hypothetical protein
MVPFASLEVVDTLVSDSTLDPGYKAMLEAHAIEVLLA